MTLDSADGKIELGDALLKLTKPDGTAIQWDTVSISDEHDAHLAKRAVLACIGFDTDALSNSVVLAWIKSRQLALAMFSYHKLDFPDKAASLAPLIDAARLDLTRVGEILVEAAQPASGIADIIRAERFDQIKASAQPFFDVWWAKKKGQTPPPLPAAPAHSIKIKVNGKLVEPLSTASPPEKWNKFFEDTCTEVNRKDVALSQAVRTQLREETGTADETLMAQVSRGHAKIKKEGLLPLIESLRKYL